MKSPTIVIAALLLILDIQVNSVQAENLLNQGEVKNAYIQLALDGMREVEKSFDMVDLNKVRENLGR